MLLFFNTFYYLLRRYNQAASHELGRESTAKVHAYQAGPRFILAVVTAPIMLASVPRTPTINTCRMG